jgi:hypothetical protein
MRENIELGSDKLNVSRHGRVMTDANHENMSHFIVLEVLRLEEEGEDIRFRPGFVTRGLFAVSLRGGDGKALSFFCVLHRRITFEVDSVSFPTNVLKRHHGR